MDPDPARLPANTGAPAALGALGKNPVAAAGDADEAGAWEAFRTLISSCSAVVPVTLPCGKGTGKSRELVCLQSAYHIRESTMLCFVQDVAVIETTKLYQTAWGPDTFVLAPSVPFN